MIKIRIAEPSDQQCWDAFISSNPNTSPYQLYAWKEAIKEAYSHKAYYLIAEKNDCICGALPIIRIKAPGLPAKLSSLPFCDVGGAVYDNNETRQALINHAHNLLGDLKASCLELRERPSSCDNTQLETASKVSMLLKLPPSSDELLASFKSKLRSQINKAKKNGLYAELGTSEYHIDEFYTVFADNMHRLGSPVHSKSLFKNLAKHYGDNMNLSLIKIGDKTIAAGIVLTINDRACIPWASTLFEYNKLSPNMLLYWSLLENLADSGCKLFDFGRSTPGEGTYKFKSQWGAEPYALQWTTTEMKGGILNNDSGPSKAREIIEQLWRKQPLATANIFGPLIRKYISL